MLGIVLGFEDTIVKGNKSGSLCSWSLESSKGDRY